MDMSLPIIDRWEAIRRLQADAHPPRLFEICGDNRPSENRVVSDIVGIDAELNEDLHDPQVVYRLLEN
jgi:hypothetical protein